MALWWLYILACQILGQINNNILNGNSVMVSVQYGNIKCGLSKRGWWFLAPVLMVQNASARRRGVFFLTRLNMYGWYIYIYVIIYIVRNSKKLCPFKICVITNNYDQTCNHFNKWDVTIKLTGKLRGKLLTHWTYHRRTGLLICKNPLHQDAIFLPRVELSKVRNTENLCCGIMVNEPYINHINFVLSLTIY